ncbi:MAG: zinc ribbon domain-containing protein [Desulfobulbaceae bacterium]|nr:zinc ribbon domain-containing protein [Desulfobulbaceae bacterium]
MSCEWGWPGTHYLASSVFGLGLLVLVAIVLLIFSRRKQLSPRTICCSACKGAIEPAYFRCPHCGNTLKGHCPNCSRIVESSWRYCPDCRAEQK